MCIRDRYMGKERIAELQLGLRTSIPAPPRLDLAALPSPYKRLSQIPAAPVLDLSSLSPTKRAEAAVANNERVVQRLDNVQEENQKLRAQVNYYKVQNDILKSNTDRMDNLIKDLSAKDTEIHLLQNQLENARIRARQDGAPLPVAGDAANLKSQLDAAIEKLNGMNYLKVQNDLLKANNDKMDNLIQQVAEKDNQIHTLQERVEELRLAQHQSAGPTLNLSLIHI
eukprot:TRINITY_DN3426_c0_g1_i1.p1 TRINITY_DN3426_c0_g1~~TRINITY_DN3426_c0_g1_i1.p1  ORF type:complete len:226 (+),score=69.71 TRINITY_DN3426_c0_g1_i1:66-743(+)